MQTLKKNILEQVINIARKNNIKFNKDKIQYGLNEVKFLGLLFNEQEMRPDPQRVKVIKSILRVESLSTN